MLYAGAEGAGLFERPFSCGVAPFVAFFDAGVCGDDPSAVVLGRA